MDSATGIPWDSILLVIAAIGALASAIAAARSASLTKRASGSSLLLELLREYASPSMHRAVLKVVEWNGSDLIERGSELDEARRVVAHHFHAIASLEQRGLLSPGIARAAVPSMKVDLFLNTIKPMERHINRHYDRSSFEAIARLTGRRLANDD